MTLKHVDLTDKTKDYFRPIAERAGITLEGAMNLVLATVARADAWDLLFRLPRREE